MAGGRRRSTCRPDPTGHPPVPAFPVYKVRLESVKASTSNPYIYYNMKLQAIIKGGMFKGTEEAV